MWLPRVTVAAIVERDSKFLLVEETINNQLTLNQPAGHLEDNESLTEAAMRETLEETGWKFTPTYLLGVYRWKHPTSENTYIRFAFGGEVYDYDPALELDKGIIGPVWLSLDEIRARREQHRSPQLLKCIEDYQQGKRYPLDSLINVL